MFICNLQCGFSFKSTIYVFASPLGFSHAKVFKLFYKAILLIFYEANQETPQLKYSPKDKKHVHYFCLPCVRS